LSLVTRARACLVQLVNVVSGLAALRVAPKAVLAAVSEVAIEKIDQFGAMELPTLLSCLASLNWHDERLLHSSAAQLTALLTDMNPRALCEVATAFAAGRAWIPPAFERLAQEAAAKVSFFSAAEAVTALAAFAQLRWDQPAASRAFGRAVAVWAPWLELNELAIGLHALTRLPDACEEETLCTLLRAVEHARFPDAGTPDEEAGAVLTMLCNALRQHGAAPPAALLASCARSPLTDTVQNSS